MKTIAETKVKFDSEYFEELLTEKNISVYKAAKTIGTSHKVVCNWCNELFVPSGEMLYKLSVLLDVAMEDLLKEV